MKMIDWGQGWKVSQLCFGVLPVGPMQKDVNPEEAGELLLESFETGINFIDTAQSYQTYPHIRYALDRWDKHHIYIASKSAAETYEKMDEAVIEALDAMNRDTIDIFHLHAARVGPAVFEQRSGALECLKEHKKKGTVGRIGISTHSVSAVREAAGQESIDVVFPLINVAGLGILDGDRDDMVEAIEKVSEAGKKLYAMKIYGGGNLLDECDGALQYVLSLKGIEVVSIGMVNSEELAINLSLLAGSADEEQLQKTASSSKQLLIAPFCAGCGTCIEKCPNQALYMDGDRCRVDTEKCILCGYCAPTCPEFAIRVI